MTTARKHGVTVVDSKQSDIADIDTSCIGIICTADDADATVFPVNVPVLITDLTTAIGSAGTQGTLARCLYAIAAGGGNCNTVVVRVPQGADDAENEANVMGDILADGSRTGLQALEVAESIVGVRPRILGAPRLDTLPVVAALTAMAEAQRSHVYAQVPAGTISQALLYRDNFGSAALTLVYGDYLAYDNLSDTRCRDYTIARLLGLRAYLDHSVGAHRSISNVVVNGVTGIADPVSWDLQSTNTGAGVLNNANISPLIQRDGYRLWGGYTCSTDTTLGFESVARMRDYINDRIAEGIADFVDRPMHKTLIRDLVNAIDRVFVELKIQGRIMGGKAYYNSALNPNSLLWQGQLAICYDWTPVTPAASITLLATLTDTYYATITGGA